MKASKIIEQLFQERIDQATRNTVRMMLTGDFKHKNSEEKKRYDERIKSNYKAMDAALKLMIKEEGVECASDIYTKLNKRCHVRLSALCDACAPRKKSLILN